MTDHRELLELAARAVGIALEQDFSDGVWKPLFYDDSLDRWKDWNPLEESGDSHDMCAALTICTDWTKRCVICVHRGTYIYEKFADHNNDRSAAWRLAALRVAAEIGKGVRG